MSHETTTTSPKKMAIRMAKIWKAGMGDAYPIDVRTLALEIAKARRERINILANENLPNKFEGVITLDDKTDSWIILVKKNPNNLGRYNFSLAHEFGHYLLHREKLSTIECSFESIYSPEASLREKQANEFASTLLMPADDFRKQIEHTELSIDTLRVLANRYSVSFTAAGIRFTQLTNSRCGVVCIRDGFVLWSSLSQRALKLRKLLFKGYELPQDFYDQVLSASEVTFSVPETYEIDGLPPFQFEAKKISATGDIMLFIEFEDDYTELEDPTEETDWGNPDNIHF